MIPSLFLASEDAASNEPLEVTKFATNNRQTLALRGEMPFTLGNPIILYFRELITDSSVVSYISTPGRTTSCLFGINTVAGDAQTLVASSIQEPISY